MHPKMFDKQAVINKGHTNVFYQAKPAEGCPWRKGLLPDIHSNTITPNPQKST